MNTSKIEYLSALLDEEAGEFERRRLLDELNRDDGLAQTLGRYALIGEAMRSASSGSRSVAGVSLLSRIQAELDEEPVYSGNVLSLPVKHKAASRYGLVGAGIAATAAAMAIGGVLWMQQPHEQTLARQTVPAVKVQTVAAMPTTPARQGDETDARITQLGRIDPQTRDVLKQYVAQHVRYASTTAIAPSVRAVSYVNEH